MKRLPLLLAAFILLVGCQAVPAETEAPADDGLITYPGTHWNMTPEELTQALGIAESDITVSNNHPHRINKAPPKRGLSVFKSNVSSKKKTAHKCVRSKCWHYLFSRPVTRQLSSA